MIQKAATEAAPEIYTPRDYQRRTLDRMAELGSGVIDAPMGSGKTLMGAWYAQEIKAKRILVICPKAVMERWAEDVPKVDPNATILLVNKGAAKKKRATVDRAISDSKVFGKALWVVINYDSVWREPLGSMAAECGFDLALLDEFQRTKSHEGRTGTWVREELPGNIEHRWGLSGTIMPHSPPDIWNPSVTLAASPPLEFTYRSFVHKYCVMGSIPITYKDKRGREKKKDVPKFKALKDSSAFAEKLSTFVVSVSRDEMDSEVPPNTTVHRRVYVDLSADAQRVYNALEAELEAELSMGTLDPDNALVRLLRLQQLTGGSVASVDEDGKKHVEHVCSAKEKAVIESLGDIGGAEPFMCFARFRTDLDAIHRAAKADGRASFELSGRCNQLANWKMDCERVVPQWESDPATRYGGHRLQRAPVLVAQIQAACEGIEATQARYCGYYSLGFSLGQYEQSLKRTDRFAKVGPRQITYLHYMARNTVDVATYGALSNRKSQIQDILDRLPRTAKRKAEKS